MYARAARDHAHVAYLSPMWHCMTIFLQVCKPFSLYYNRMMLTGLWVDCSKTWQNTGSYMYLVTAAACCVWGQGSLIKYFSGKQFSYIVRVITWREEKMHSATSLQGPGLVRTVGLCAQTRVAIETYFWTSGAKRCAFREACWAGQFDVQAERERRPCTLLSGEFEQLFLACSKGCGLRDIRFKVRVLLSAHAHCTNGDNTVVFWIFVLLIARAY